MEPEDELATNEMETNPLRPALLDVDKFLALEIPNKSPILYPWLTEQSINLVSGWRGTGKTWFALSLFDCISKGQGFGPWNTVSPVPCLYMDGEMTTLDIQHRLRLLMDADHTERKSNLIIYSDAYANSLGIPRARLDSALWRSELKELLIGEGIKLVCFDNIASLTPGKDENIKKDWDETNQWLLGLRFEGISSLLLHHTGKAGQQRGTSAREDNINVSIVLVKPSDYIEDEGAKFLVRFSKIRGDSRDQSLLQDLEFTLTQTEDRVGWAWANVRGKIKYEILTMLAEGVKQVEICTLLQVSKGYVSQIKAEGVKSGLLSPTGKLTKAGKDEIYGKIE